MKKHIITSLFVILTMGVAAQNADITSVKNDTASSKPFVCNLAEEMPRFPGGEQALMEFLKENLKYPKLAEKYAVEGKVIMTFFVENDGQICNISALNCRIERFKTTMFSQEPEVIQKQLKEQFALLFAKEGARVIRKMPKWIPGKLNGTATKMKYNLPIHFFIPNKL